MLTLYGKLTAGVIAGVICCLMLFIIEIENLNLCMLNPPGHESKYQLQSVHSALYPHDWNHLFKHF